MQQQALFAGGPVPNPTPQNRGPDGKYRVHPGPIPASAEVATAQKGEFLAPLTIWEYPNFSSIIGHRDRGLGIKFYDTMLGSDADLSGFFRDLVDDVLHYPYTITPASEKPEHLQHARFLEFALRRIPTWQNIVRHALDSYPRGFAVFEKVYEVIDSGEWAGAVTFATLMDKPQRWFAFDPDRNLRFKTVHNIFPGELVDQDKFFVVTFGTNSNPWGEALLDLCYWPWFLKHHGLKNQAVFMEKWASPTAKVEYEHSPSNEKANELNKQKALSVAMAIQNDQAVAYPKGMLLSLIESMRNGTVSWPEYIKDLTEMESRLVTGQLLTSMGAQGGSHALGKVHEKRAANKVEMLAEFISFDFLSRKLGRELIVRNYGRQDAYPEVRILAVAPLERQAEATIAQQLQGIGLDLSRAHSVRAFGVVPPINAADILRPSVLVKPGQVLPANPQLAAPVTVDLAAYGDLHRATAAKAAQTRGRLDKIGKDAVAKARPAIRKVVKSLASTVRAKGKNGLAQVRKRHVYGALKGASGTHELGGALNSMLDRPAQMHYAAGDAAPPDISTDAKLALALQMIAIAARIIQAQDDAPQGMDAGAFADSLTDPNGVGVDETFANLFDGVHSTNIASVATARLREQLADPKFRRDFPYVMIVATNPNVRLPHRMLDGYILSAEEARYSPFLPPFDFGCDCIAIPISAADATARGLTGAAPVGSLDEFLQSKGATPHPRAGYVTPGGEAFRPGAPAGFSPAFPGTDYGVQLDALRQKAEELRAEDPEAWVELQKYLQWLFGGVDVLRQDPPVN